MTTIETLESKVKRYIQFLLEEPPLEELAESEGEVVSMPLPVLEQLLGDDDYYFDYHDYDDDYAAQLHAQQGDAYFQQTVEVAYNVRRLRVPERRPETVAHPRAKIAEHFVWAAELKELDPRIFPEPEPIRQSPTRLEHLLNVDLRRPLEKLTRVLGIKGAQAMFYRASERFLSLLEMCAVYEAFDDELVNTALTVLGERNVKRLMLKTVEWFPRELLRYLQPLRAVPSLPYVAELEGEGLLQAYRQAATRDIQAGKDTEIRSITSELAMRTMVLGLLGAEGKKLIDHLGVGFVKQHLLKPGSVAIELVDLGIPIWEEILRERLGIVVFKTMLIENPRQLQRTLSQMFRTPHSAAVIKVMGEEKVRQLLRSSEQATVQLSSIGHLIGIRPFLCDDPGVVAEWHPGILEVLALGSRFDLVVEAVRHIGHEPSYVDPNQEVPDTESWMRATTHLLQELKRIQDAGFYPRPELLLPILKEPEAASGCLGSYYKIRRTLLDIEQFDLLDLVKLTEPIEVVVAIAYGVVRGLIGGSLPFSQFKDLFGVAVEHLRRGAVVPALPPYARPIRLTVREAFFQHARTLDAQGLTAIQSELLAMEGEHNLLRAWKHSLDLARAAGYRLASEARSRLDRRIAEGQLTTVAAEGFSILFRCVLERYNRLVSEALVRLLIGHHLHANTDLKERLRSEDAKQITDALYELFAERLYDVAEALFVPFRDITAEWFEEQDVPGAREASVKVQSTVSLGDLYRVIAAESEAESVTSADVQRLRMRLRKVFPLTTDLFLRYRSLILRESAKLRPVASNRNVTVLSRPSRSLLNVFSGVHGEDCSATPLHVGRLFHPNHVFYQMLIDDSELVQGYISVLKISRGEETALKFDVINPSNNVNLDAQDFLKKVVEAFGQQASQAGINYGGITDQWVRVSNRSSLAQAAQALYQTCPVEEGFILEPPADYFQSSTGGLRVIYKGGGDH